MPGYGRDITAIIKHYDPIGSGTIKMIMAEDLYNPQVLTFALIPPNGIGRILNGGDDYEDKETMWGCK